MVFRSVNVLASALVDSLSVALDVMVLLYAIRLEMMSLSLRIEACCLLVRYSI